MQLQRSTPLTPSGLHPSIAGPDSPLRQASEASTEARKESTLLHTKTRLPRTGCDTLRRDRLEGLSEEIRQRLLTLVMAPPGCGKTTLTRQWADRFASQGTCVAWFSIDVEDNDPQRFLLYVHQAVAHAGFGRRAIRTGAGSGPRRDAPPPGGARPAAFHSASEASSAFINRVAEVGDDLVIVLDNYSWITHPAVHGQVAYILDNAPPNLHLIILASAPPPLQLGRLRAQNRLLELNSSAIRFNRSETLQLLQPAAGPLVPDEHLHELYKVTQGWAAAVRIFAVTLSKLDNASAFKRGIVDCRTFDAIDEYLDDLFASYPDDMIEMMIDTAFVDSVSSPLCRALTERGDTETYFSQLKQQQVLLPLDSNQEKFAYPALVRRYLYKKLVRKGHGHLSRLHRRAHGWYSQNGQWDLAVNHALASGDTELALRWMERHAMAIVKAGNLGALLRWHQETGSRSIIPPQRVQLAFAWAHALSQSQDAAFALLATIEAPSVPRHPPSSAIQAECDAIRATAHALADQIEPAVESAARCVNHPFSDDWIGSVVANVALYCRFRTGQWAAVFSEPTVLDTQVEGQLNCHVLRLSILGLAGLLRGQLDLAEKYCVDALRISPTGRDKDAQSFYAWPAGVLASVYYEAGRLDELEALLDHRLDEIAHSGYLDCTLEAFLAAARTAAKRGKLADALTHLEQAEGIAIKRKWVRLEAAVLLERVRLFLHENQPEEAQGCLQRLAQLPDAATAAEHASPLCSTRQSTTIASACLAIHSGSAEAAIAPLQALVTHFSGVGNELLCVRLGTLLSIAHLKSGHGEAAHRTFRGAMEKAARGGFISAIADQGAEAGRLLSGLCASLRDSADDQRLRKHCERLLRDPGLCIGPSMAGGKVTDKRDDAACALTPKENQVLTLIAHGQSNKEIARSLGVAPETIKTHLKNIFAKLSVDRRIQAIAKAQSLGVVFQ